MGLKSSNPSENRSVFGFCLDLLSLKYNLLSGGSAVCGSPLAAMNSGDMLSGTSGVKKTSVRSACSPLGFQTALRVLSRHLAEAQIQICHSVYVRTLLKTNDI